MTERKGESRASGAPETTVWSVGDREDLREGGTWLLDLVATVDHLARGHRHVNALPIRQRVFVENDSALVDCQSV